MKLDIFGNDSEGYSCSGEYENGIDPALSVCPFCGSDRITVSNTHSPAYWAECECGAEMHRDNYPVVDQFFTKEKCAAAHKKAFFDAIAAWNERTQ